MSEIVYFDTSALEKWHLNEARKEDFWLGKSSSHRNGGSLGGRTSARSGLKIAFRKG